MYKKITFLFLFIISISFGQINFKEHLIEENFQNSIFSKAVDIDNDGDIDVIATANVSDELAWFENDGNQNFTKHIIESNYNGASNLLIVDINNDGNIDVLAQRFTSIADNEYNFFINDGLKNFTKVSMQNLTGYAYLGADIKDFEGDGDFDIMYKSYSTSEFVWYENTGDLNFVEQTISFDSQGKAFRLLEDLDSDGDMDLYTLDSLNQYQWHENIGNQTFTAHNSTFELNGDGFISLYNEHNDIDKDGDLDLLGRSSSDNKIYWYENDGFQNYSQHVIDSNISTPYFISSSDFDNDGDIDIASAAFGDNQVTWYENDGSQNFIKRSIGTVNGPFGHSLIDIDSDNDVDVVINGYWASNLLWYENNLLSKNIDNYIYQTPILGNHNYVYTISPQKAVTTLDSIKTNKDAIESVGYFDGLGRPMQQVAIRAGGKGEDLITPIEYDDLGRQVKEFLPFAQSSNIGEKLRQNIDINSFYKTKYASDFVNTPEVDINPYSEMRYEASPLNRVLEQGAPGESWRVDTQNDNDHTIKFEYKTNDTLSVRLFEVTFVDSTNTEAPTLTEIGYYNPNELYKTITKDENWQPAPAQTNDKDHTTEEFKDKRGRVVLKRTYNLNQEHNTYYVYDEFGNLTYVVPPKAADNTTIDQPILDELCYQYKYDYRNRLIEKKIPGKGLESIVYDNLDRPVLTQDANLNTQGVWLFTKYDVFGRVIYTGKFTDGSDRTTLQATFTAKNTTESNYEAKGASNFGIEYTNADFPSANLEVLTVNYYDDYSFTGAPFNPALNPETVFDVATTDKTKSLATGSKVKVLGTTDTWITTVTYYDEKARPIYVYSQNDFLNTTDVIKSDLDFTGRVLKTRTSHIKTDNSEPELVTLDTFTYDQAGRVLKQVQCIGGPELEDDCGAYGADGLENTLVTTETVNPGVSTNIEASNTVVLKSGFVAKPIAGLTVEVKINAAGAITGSQVEMIAENSYDDLGQLVTKKVGNTESVALQTIEYDYNVRGWLKNINEDTSNDNDLFNFTLIYNDIADVNKRLYNGNISQTLWSSLSDNSGNTNPVSSEYTYTYDALNRITSAVDNTTNQNYSLQSISYDKNGNIQNLLRKGHTVLDGNGQVTDFGMMDNLVYDYGTANGNKLLSVTEQSGSSAIYGFKDGNTSGNDYDYDNNGNMTQDLNKDIDINGISYNHLNLPTLVDFGGGNKIEYFYDASGMKLQKKVAEGSSVTITDYAGNYVYENSNLQFFSQPEGYVTPNGSSFKYVYQYKDHLGNVRLSYNDANSDGSITTSEIIEENNYYPFGLKHKGYNTAVGAGGNSVAQKRKFGGNELQDELGLEWYDITARNYDPALGRWMNLDPLAEQMRRHSPYNYAFNNPIFFVDPDGMAPLDFYLDENGNYLGEDGAITNNVRVIYKSDFDDTQSNNGGSTKSVKATSELQSLSNVVTVNEAQIQNDVNDVNNETVADNTIERQAYITLNIDSKSAGNPTAEVTSSRGADGTDGNTTITSGTTRDGRNTIGGQQNVLIGQVHSHNTVQTAGLVNVEGTSTQDTTTAGSLGISVYSIDSYKGVPSISAPGLSTVSNGPAIHRTTADGNKTNNVGTTNNQRIGKDALSKYIKRIIK